MAKVLSKDEMARILGGDGTVNVGTGLPTVPDLSS